MTNSGDRWWDARLAAFEAVLGSSDEMVGHAPIPFDMGADIGGAADVLFFRQKERGVLAVTAELIGRDDQVPSALGNYELAICHRTAERWGPRMISQLAHYTLEAALNPGETMDISSAVPEGSTISALLFYDYARMQVSERTCGILLCIGITGDELAACQAGRTEEIDKLLRDQGVYPYTELLRPSVVRPKKRWGLF